MTRGDAPAHPKRALQALLAVAGRFNSAYGAELARKSQFLDLEHVAGVLLAFDRAAERESPVIAPLTEELWDGLVIRLHQGREIYGGLQARRHQRNGLILPSERRTVASMTQALARFAGDDARFQILIDALVVLGRGDGWGTTNANAAALLALSEILRPPFAGSTPRTVQVRLPGLPLPERTVRLGPDAPTAFRLSRTAGAAEVSLIEGSSERPSGREGASPLVIRGDRGGIKGPLVVRAETSYLPAADGSQVAPRRDGFVVTRELLLQQTDPPERVPLDEAGKTVPLAIGDVVEEHVQVVNPDDRNYVAIIVPLAAGMEPLNPNLATAPPEARPTGQLTLAPTYVAFLDDHVGFYYNTLPKGTYDFYLRTRASTEGSFIQPAARAEMMYDGSVVGTSAGARVEIERGEQ